MAASSPEKDYIHLVMAGIKAKNPNATYQLLWGVPFEQDWNKYDYNILDGYKRYAADLIILRIGENIDDAKVESGKLRRKLSQVNRWNFGSQLKDHPNQ